MGFKKISLSDTKLTQMTSIAIMSFSFSMTALVKMAMDTIPASEWQEAAGVIKATMESLCVTLSPDATEEEICRPLEKLKAKYGEKSTEEDD